MGLTLSPENIAALETRTEGWIAGLQLAALSMQGQKDTAGFIQSFTGSHRFVMDYLVEEVFHSSRQTSRRSCCAHPSSTACAVPFVMQFCSTRPRPDRKRWSIWIVQTCSSSRWITSGAGTGITISLPICCGSVCTKVYRSSGAGHVQSRLSELHIRASQWYEDNGLADGCVSARRCCQ